LGKKKKLRIEGKRVSMHEGLLVITAVQVNLARGSTGALEARGDLQSWAMGTVKKVIFCLPQTWLERFQSNT
jgi:hypothetical protein